MILHTLFKPPIEYPFIVKVDGKKIISASQVQRMVSEFTMSKRYWTGYPIHHVEVILRFYGRIDGNEYYHGFEEQQEVLMFTKQTEPTRVQRILLYLLRKTGWTP